jgi:hypothetical protein
MAEKAADRMTDLRDVPVARANNGGRRCLRRISEVRQKPVPGEPAKRSWVVLDPVHLVNDESRALF